ncbi:MAG: hypothetical protein ACHQ50_07460 [Fimbriimonadales bacterium]
MSFTVVSRCLAVVCVVITLLWSRDLFTLVGTRGILDPNLPASLKGLFPLSLYHWIPATSRRVDLAILILINTVAVTGAILFWKPRSVLAALGLYLTFVCFKQTVALLAYGVYEYLQLGLFYILIANVAAFAFRQNSEEAWKAERLVGWFFRGHVAMAYFFAGACKAVGPQWWTGESMWRALSRSDSTGQRWFNFEWTGHYPLLLQIVGITTVCFETLYPLAFFRRLRPFIVAGMICMHFGTIVSQGLTLFGLTMICLNVFFWLESREWEAGIRVQVAGCGGALSAAAEIMPRPGPVILERSEGSDTGGER